MMALKRKACDSFEQQPVTKDPSTATIPSSAQTIFKHKVNRGEQSSQNNTEKHTTQDDSDPASTPTSLAKSGTPVWGNLTPKKSSHHVFSVTELQQSYTHSILPRHHGMTTRRITKFKTYNAIFNTGELLEHIISALPAASIITLRRVNKTWNHVILTLPTIRRKLFLDPEPLGNFWVFDNHTRRVLPYISGMCTKYGSTWENRQSYCRPVTLNTMIFKRDPGAHGQIPLSQRARSCESLRFTAPPNLRQKTGSIFHQMFLTQPPVTTVEFVFFYHDRNLRRQRLYSPTLSQRLRVVRHGGVRFVDVLSAFLRQVSSSFTTPVHAQQHHLAANSAQQASLPPPPSPLSLPLLPPDFSIHISRTSANNRVNNSPHNTSINNSRNKKPSTIWMLGGILVSPAEQFAVESLRERMIYHYHYNYFNFYPNGNGNCNSNGNDNDNDNDNGKQNHYKKARMQAPSLSPQAQELMRGNNGKSLNFRPTAEEFVGRRLRVRGEVEREVETGVWGGEGGDGGDGGDGGVGE